MIYWSASELNDTFFLINLALFRDKYGSVEAVDRGCLKGELYLSPYSYPKGEGQCDAGRLLVFWNRTGVYLQFQPLLLVCTCETPLRLICQEKLEFKDTSTSCERKRGQNHRMSLYRFRILKLWQWEGGLCEKRSFKKQPIVSLLWLPLYVLASFTNVNGLAFAKKPSDREKSINNTLLVFTLYHRGEITAHLLSNRVAIVALQSFLQ